MHVDHLKGKQQYVHGHRYSYEASQPMNNVRGHSYIHRKLKDTRSDSVAPLSVHIKTLM